MSNRSCSSTRLICSPRNCHGHHLATTSPTTPAATTTTQHATTFSTGSSRSTKAQRRSKSTRTIPVQQIPSKSSVCRFVARFVMHSADGSVDVMSPSPLRRAHAFRPHRHAIHVATSTLPASRRTWWWWDDLRFFGRCWRCADTVVLSAIQDILLQLHLRECGLL